MRQTARLKSLEDGHDAPKDVATDAGQTIDAWIAAALAEQAKRAAPRASEELGQPASESAARSAGAPRSRAVAETSALETLMAATAASERRAAEMAAKTTAAKTTAAKTTAAETEEPRAPVTKTTDAPKPAGVAETTAQDMAAPGSIASWIEQAQERLAGATAAVPPARERTATAVGGATDTLAHELDSFQRKVESGERSAESQAQAARELTHSRLGASSDGDDAPTVIADSLDGIEVRMKGLSDRLAGSRPTGRRGIASADELNQAVAEIRSHQVAIAAGPAARRFAPVAAPSLAVPAPAMFSPDAPGRGFGDMLSAMRTDIARIAGKVENPRPPALDGLKNEIDALRGSLADLPKREDLGAIEQSVAALAEEVTTIRREGRAIGISQMDALQAEIRRIGAVGGSADHAKLSRDLDVLTHKLDIVSAGGIDPGTMAAMAGQLDEIRASLDGLASTREVASLGQQVADLKRDVAVIGEGQIDPADFASLKGTVEEIRTTLARPVPGGSKGAGPVQLARGQLEPIESMLMTLADKIDRVERQVADPEALDQLERQLAALTTVLGPSGGRDPSLATLEHAMSALLREVGSWRDGAADIADRAARSAVAEAVRSPASDQVPHDEYVRQLAGMRQDYAAIEARVGRSLDGVQATLQGVVQRLGGIDRQEGPGAPRQEAAAEPSGVAARPAQRPQREPQRAAPSGDDHLAEPVSEEILLEPGERPRGLAAGTPTIDPGDIKSSFIAAARRAAQAAAADAAANKGGRAETDVEAASRTEILGRMRALFEKQRRPLLIGAAAIALALGGFQLTREKAVDRSAFAGGPAVNAPQVVAPTQPGPAPVQTARPASTQPRPTTPDPQTTQSLAEGALDAPRTQPETVAAQPTPAQPIGQPLAAQPPVASAQPAASPQAAASPPKVDALDTARLASLSGMSPKPGAAPAVTAGPTTSPSDPAAAITALRQAAVAGNALALYDLGLKTSEGRGVPRDLQLGTGYFEKAAEKGLAPAQYRTGNAYEKGVGVARDLEVAKTWYKRAAESGNTRAMHNLAVLIAEGAGGKPDYPAASGWFQRAAEQGVRDSQYNLAVLYARGLGTVQDFSKSYLWFAIAAGQGDEDAGRKRDEVGARLSTADLARAKTAVERWRATPANVTANEVAPPTLPSLPTTAAGTATGTGDMPFKRQQREGRG